MTFNCTVRVMALLAETILSSGGSSAAPQSGPSPSPTSLAVKFQPCKENKHRVVCSWDGSVSVASGKVIGVHHWVPDVRNHVEGNHWEMDAVATLPRRGLQWMQVLQQRRPAPVTIRVDLEEMDGSEPIQFSTAHGDFSLCLDDILPGGEVSHLLGGQVSIRRGVMARTLWAAATDDVFPAVAADPSGRLHVAHLAFTAAAGHAERGSRIVHDPDMDTSVLADPPGGDQLLLHTWDGGSWSGPVALTEPGGDLLWPTITADRKGAIWAFWSEKVDSSWDLVGCRADEGGCRSRFQVSQGGGPDFFPAAATDSDGRVWLVWQSFQEGRSVILASQQSGRRMGSGAPISEQAGDAWAPALAASQDGVIAVAWDTYARGNYDVMVRFWRDGAWGPVLPLAISERAELRPSIDFDAEGRLWVAYEDAPEGWGKDWSLLDQEGVGLLGWRGVSVRVVTPDGRLFSPTPPTEQRAPGSGAGFDWESYDESPWTSPILRLDRDGRVWLAVKTRGMWPDADVGAVWYDQVLVYQGSRWSNPIWLSHTDGPLDERPAMVARTGGGVVLVASSDERAESSWEPNYHMRKALDQRAEERHANPWASSWVDPVNGEIVWATVSPLPGEVLEPPALWPLPVPHPAGPDAGLLAEAEAVARCRGARVIVHEQELQLLRGDLHRHTDWSADGMHDGSSTDLWRYALNAASLDFAGPTDHAYGEMREYAWWHSQQVTDLFSVQDRMIGIYGYERHQRFPRGHRNVFFAQRGVRPLAWLAWAKDEKYNIEGEHADHDLQMLYRHLDRFSGVVIAHTSANANSGTNWSTHDARLEPVVELYQGSRYSYEGTSCPRCSTDSVPCGTYRAALKEGHRLGVIASSDHISTHTSYAMVWASESTGAGVLAGLRARHTYAATDNIVAEFWCGDAFMGEEASIPHRPSFKLRLQGTAPFQQITWFRDGEEAGTLRPGLALSDHEWMDEHVNPGESHAYYVRAEQQDGELVWLSPIWVTWEAADTLPREVAAPAG